MRDKVKRNFVCVKIIKIKNIPKKEREATRVEVDLLRRLNHPNIVRYIDSFLSKNKESLCICMEYCDGVRFKAAPHRVFSTDPLQYKCIFLNRVISHRKSRPQERTFSPRAKSSTGLCSSPWVCITCTAIKYCTEISRRRMCSCLAMAVLCSEIWAFRRCWTAPWTSLRHASALLIVS